MSVMNATAPIASSSPSANEQTPGPRHGDRPTWVERIAETAPIIDAPAYFGPPVSFVLGPWLLLLLLLIGPAALLITLVLAFVLAAGALAALVALLASPYLLVRHLRARHPAWRHRFAFAGRHAGVAPAVDSVPHPARRSPSLA